MAEENYYHGFIGVNLINYEYW